MEDEQHRHHSDGVPGHGIGGGPECTMCPVCVFLQAVTSVRPEMTQHLLNAGRELALALTAAIEAQAEAFDHASTRQRERTESATARTRVERIRID